MVKEEKLPQTHGIKNALPHIDFTDTFSVTNHDHTLEEISNLIFDNTPSWIQHLMNFRNFIAKRIGLRTEIPEEYHTNFELGGYIGFFKIYQIHKDELILGANDDHLNFRVSIYNTKERYFNIKVSTLVEYCNLKGKLYMFFVKPFHRIVVKSMVQQAYMPDSK